MSARAVTLCCLYSNINDPIIIQQAQVSVIDMLQQGLMNEYLTTTHDVFCSLVVNSDQLMSPLFN